MASTVLGDRTPAGPAPILRRLHCVFTLAEASREGREGDTRWRRESGLWLPFGRPGPRQQRLVIFLSICGVFLLDNVRVFLHTCSCFYFSVFEVSLCLDVSLAISLSLYMLCAL